MRKASILLETFRNRASVAVITSNSSNSLRGVLSSKMNGPLLRAWALGSPIFPGMPFGVKTGVSASIVPSFQMMIGSTPLLGAIPSAWVGGD